jgi:hypothetical protein
MNTVLAFEGISASGTTKIKPGKTQHNNSSRKKRSRIKK